MRLSVMQLEAREVPALVYPTVMGEADPPSDPFPGFSGDVEVVRAKLTPDVAREAVAVSGEGGGPRVAVFDGTTGARVADFFAFDPHFAGGVNVKVVKGERPLLDSDRIILTPKAGGGPLAVVLTFDENGAVIDNKVVEPYGPEAFRGGLLTSYGDFDGDGDTDLIFLPDSTDGYAPRVVAVDAASGAQVASFFAPGGESARFEPTGGVIQYHGHLAVAIEYPPVIDGRIRTILWDLAGNQV